MSKPRSAIAEREALRQWNRGEPLDGRAVVPPVQLSLDDAALELGEPLELEQAALGGIAGEPCGWVAAREACMLIPASACSLACMLAHRRAARPRKRA
jgi:hypothetical protein